MRRFSQIALLATLFACSACATFVPQQTPIQITDGVHTTESWSYEDCGTQADPIQIKSIKVSPDPPKPGEDLTVEVNAIATRTIEEGAYADVTVKLGLIKLLHKQFDVCEEARNADADIQCPVTTGEYNVKHTVALPKEVPKAKFTVQVRGYTVADDDMLCLNLKVDFMKRPFPKLW
ncbi:ML domain-containing protein [Infundibulicybe gibba]|nr:ML domain-containing protein [Infundibulicybe gibba]